MALLPIAIAGAAIGGTLGFLSARERNEAIARASQVSQERINKIMMQTRMDSALRVEQTSRAAQRALGARMNVSPEHLGSMDAVALEVDGVFSDTDAINEERDRRMEAFIAEKQNIATEASNQSQNELLAGASGALQGFQAGAGLGGTIDEAIAAGRISDFSAESRALQLEEQRANTSSATMRRDLLAKQGGDLREDVGRARAGSHAVGNVVLFN